MKCLMLRFEGEVNKSRHQMSLSRKALTTRLMVSPAPHIIYKRPHKSDDESFHSARQTKGEKRDIRKVSLGAHGAETYNGIILKCCDDSATLRNLKRLSRSFKLFQRSFHKVL